MPHKGMNKGLEWTDKDVQMLSDLHHGGMSNAEIGRKLYPQRTANAISCKLSEIKANGKYQPQTLTRLHGLAIGLRSEALDKRVHVQWEI